MPLRIKRKEDRNTGTIGCFDMSTQPSTMASNVFSLAHLGMPLNFNVREIETEEENETKSKNKMEIGKIRKKMCS